LKENTPAGGRGVEVRRKFINSIQVCAQIPPGQAGGEMMMMMDVHTQGFHIDRQYTNLEIFSQADKRH
jgi:hypothetical protein